VDAHLRDVQGLAPETRKLYLRIVDQFLEGQFKGDAIQIGRLSPDHVRQFFARQLGVGNRSAYASSLSAGLLGYFRYRATCGDPTGHLAAAIQNPVHWKLASLPRAIEPEESERLLDAAPRIARRHPMRGYAIVRCALDLGLCCGEIAHLGLADIDWRNGTVTLMGTKTKRQDVLPSPMETGQALADYLQHERPASKHPSLFVLPSSGGSDSTSVRGTAFWPGLPTTWPSATTPAR